jgi:hypothetical protein
MPRSASASRWLLHRPPSRSMFSRQFRRPTTSGPLATGPGMVTTTISCRAAGLRHLSLATSGRLDTGAGATVATSSIRVIGVRISAFTVASTTASDMAVSAIAAVTGGMVTSATTSRSTISTEISSITPTTNASKPQADRALATTAAKVVCGPNRALQSARRKLSRTPRQLRLKRTRSRWRELTEISSPL